MVTVPSHRKTGRPVPFLMIFAAIMSLAIGAVGIFFIMWAALIGDGYVESPKLPWSSIELGGLGIFYMMGHIINGLLGRRAIRRSAQKAAQRPSISE
jgi:hypothetical protein